MPGITLDSVKTFSEYTHLSRELVYQFSRAEGFPKIQLKKSGKIMIEREPAVEWLRTQSKMRK